MTQERSGEQEMRAPANAAIWIEDDKQTAEQISEEIRQALGVPVYSLSERDGPLMAVLENIHDYSLRKQEATIMLMTARDPSYYDSILAGLTAFPLMAVISDLVIGGDRLAGLKILASSSKARIKPFLALYTGQVDPSIKEISDAVGVDMVLGKSQGPAEIMVALSRRLDLRAASVTEEHSAESLIRENDRLRLRCEELEQRLLAVSSKLERMSPPIRSQCRSHKALLMTLRKRCLNQKRRAIFSWLMNTI